MIPPEHHHGALREVEDAARSVHGIQAHRNQSEDSAEAKPRTRMTASSSIQVLLRSVDARMAASLARICPDNTNPLGRRPLGVAPSVQRKRHRSKVGPAHYLPIQAHII